MKTFFYGLCLFALGTLTAQVGINTTNPHPSAALDIVPDVSKQSVGLLMPNLSTAQRNGLNKSLLANSLLVYDTDLKMYMYFDKASSNWYALNGFKTTVTERNGSKDTLTKHTGTLILGTSKPDSSTLIVNGDAKFNGKIKSDVNSTGNVIGQKIYGEGTMPAGAIIMWSGNPLSLPKGWALCDGTNGTPNLKGRFIVGYDPNDADYNATQKTGPNFTDADGTSDGTNTQDAKQVRLLSTQSGLPSHGHKVIDEGHVHNFKDLFQGDGHVASGGGERVADFQEIEALKTTEKAFTGISINNSDEQNAANNIENRPPYYVLAYIIKLNY